MRLLMWFTIGFAAACGLAVYLISGSWLLYLALFCLCAGISLAFLKTRTYKIAAIALIGCFAGLLWNWCYNGLYLNAAREYDGQTVSLVVTVSDYSYETDYGYAADGTVKLNGRRYQIRVYIAGTGDLAPGDQVIGDVRLRLTVEGGKQHSTYHQGNGIFLLGYVQDDVQIVKAEAIPAENFAAKLRHDILNMLDALFPQDTLAFARALLLGDSSKLTYEEDTAFKLSGIRHVIAVSGLHISILFSLVYLVSGHHRVLTSVIGIPVLVVFAAIAGFTPSIVRACIMQGLICIALLLDKEYDPPTALAAAVLVMLFANPMTITSVSFQLSVGCMVGIFLFSGKIHDYLLRGKRKELAKGRSIRAKLIRWTVGSISVTLGAMIATTPLSAWYFGTVSILGVVTNILALWMVSFVFYGIMLACVAGAVWLPLGTFIAEAISWLMRYILWIAKAVASVPLAAVYTCSVYIVIWLVLSYCLLAVFMLLRKKRPGVLLGCILAGLLLSVGASYVEPRLDDCRITALDVGQGQCILFQCGGENYLVDCGGDVAVQAADSAAELLLSQGVFKLDGIILTHYDKDHAEGIIPLLTRIAVETLYLTYVPDNSGIRQVLSEQYSDKIVWVAEDKVLEGKSSRITVYAPPAETTDNESSLCILFQAKNCDILITGDRSTTGERALLAHTELPELELLIVGHHGSATSTGFDLLEVTKPKAAVISVGKDNYHGHPTWDVLARLALFQTQVWRTDQHGTIVFRG